MGKIHLQEIALEILVLMPVCDSIISGKPLSAFPDRLRERIAHVLEVCEEQRVRQISYVSHEHVIAHADSGNYLIEKFLFDHDVVRRTLDLAHWYCAPKFTREGPQRYSAGPPLFCVHCRKQQTPKSIHCFNRDCASHALWKAVDAEYELHERNTGAKVLAGIPLPKQRAQAHSGFRPDVDDMGLIGGSKGACG